MTLVKVLPLGMTHTWYKDVFGVYAVLLKDTVASIPDTARTSGDLIAAGYEVDTAGGYPSGGVPMNSVFRTENSTAGVVEYDALGSVWTQRDLSVHFTVPAFRWIVLCKQGGAQILAAHDLGGTLSITSGTLKLAVTQSPYSPGVYPILRIKRVLT